MSGTVDKRTILHYTMLLRDAKSNPAVRGSAPVNGVLLLWLGKEGCTINPERVAEISAALHATAQRGGRIVARSLRIWAATPLAREMPRPARRAYGRLRRSQRAGEPAEERREPRGSRATTFCTSKSASITCLARVTRYAGRRTVSLAEAPSRRPRRLAGSRHTSQVSEALSGHGEPPMATGAAVYKARSKRVHRRPARGT